MLYCDKAFKYDGINGINGKMEKAYRAFGNIFLFFKMEKVES